MRTASAGSAVCNCSTETMQNVLQQLKGKTVNALHTIDNSNGKFLNASIESAENFIVKFASNGQTHYVPTGLIVAVELLSDSNSQISIDLKDGENENGCNCNEKALNQFLKDLAGKNVVDFDTLAEQLSIVDASISKVSKGIVIFTTREIQYVTSLNYISDLSNLRPM